MREVLLSITKGQFLIWFDLVQISDGLGFWWGGPPVARAAGGAIPFFPG